MTNYSKVLALLVGLAGAVVPIEAEAARPGPRGRATVGGRRAARPAPRAARAAPRGRVARPALRAAPRRGAARRPALRAAPGRRPAGLARRAGPVGRGVAAPRGPARGWARPVVRYRPVGRLAGRPVWGRGWARLPG